MKQKLMELKTETDKFTSIVRNFNLPLSVTDRIGETSPAV